MVIYYCNYMHSCMYLNINEPLGPFPFGVAAEQKGGQG